MWDLLKDRTRRDYRAESHQRKTEVNETPLERLKSDRLVWHHWINSVLTRDGLNERADELIRVDKIPAR
jgi:hypothetical protein